MATYKPLTAENCKDFKNFSYSEFKCKCGGKYCNGYPVPFSYELAKNLQTIRTHFGQPLYITSPLRCEQHNKNSGGTANSKHKKGWAVDFYVKGVSFSELQKYCKTLPYYNYSYRINNNQDVIHFDIIPPNETNVIQPVQRDETKDQLKVLSTGLQVREYDTKTAKVLGQVATNGIYNFYETSDNEGYTWYRIGDKQWIANIKLEIYPKKGEEETTEMPEETSTQDFEKIIEELNVKILDLKTEVKTLNDELVKAQSELDEEKVYKYKHKAEVNGRYSIDLNIDEILIIK